MCRTHQPRLAGELNSSPFSIATLVDITQMLPSMSLLGRYQVENDLYTSVTLIGTCSHGVPFDSAVHALEVLCVLHGLPRQAPPPAAFGDA